MLGVREETLFQQNEFFIFVPILWIRVRLDLIKLIHLLLLLQSFLVFRLKGDSIFEGDDFVVDGDLEDLMNLILLGRGGVVDNLIPVGVYFVFVEDGAGASKVAILS